MANADFRVFVRRNAQGGATAVVKSASNIATKGGGGGGGGGNGMVVVTNLTNDEIIVSMPGGVFDTSGVPGSPPDSPKKHPIPGHLPGNAHVRNLPVHGNGREGVYEFQIFVKETFSFATANSDPEFIIE